MPFKKRNKKRPNIEHEQLTTLINSLADAVIALNEQAEIVRFNAAALSILDLNTLELNTPLDKVFKPIDKTGRPVDVRKLVLSVKLPETNRDMRLRYWDNSIINLYISIAPVRLGYGTRGQKGFVVLLRDITREKSLEEERDEFISVTSHELRTPIAIAEGNLSNAIFMASKESVPESITNALKSAHDQVLFLADMINDLSTLSRAERGVLQVDVSAINIKELINDLAASYRKQITDKGLTIRIELEHDAVEVHSSKLYVREIMQNFITNAIKYTSEGEIIVKASKVANGVKLSVKDSGIGISKADQERVFEKFFRSEDFRTRQANGTGLGLYVTMKLVRLIHAEVSLESELNYGSTFSVVIPDLKG
ncbi:MAG TPA: ATP-binding protein [Candidatus Saccharimonadales bacterium]|nr:ATP-binding protein [Candidatus Saccharimonadales bacterium]